MEGIGAAFQILAENDETGDDSRIVCRTLGKILSFDLYQEITDQMTRKPREGRPSGCSPRERYVE